MPTTLHRTVLPADGDPAVLPLYVEGPARPQVVAGRRRLRVPAGERVSLAAYANAFPASYWQRWTSVTEVRLELTLSAPATVEVYRSDADGDPRRVQAIAADAGVLVIRLPLREFDAGGWYWFEVVAGAQPVELADAGWVADVHTAPRVSVGVTTHNRVDRCCDLLHSLVSDAELVGMLEHVYVVDQGEQRVAESSGLAVPFAVLGPRLRLVEQANLGGSGGFARAQLETLDAGTSDFVLLLDDDIRIDPELLRRLVVFAALCRRRCLVGAPMLSLERPTELHAVGERVQRSRFWWQAVDLAHRDQDLATVPWRRSSWLHRRHDVDYNGWWACAVPRTVLADVGLSLPLFLKWDDAEYGLRAGAAGHPTVTLPGAGVWHLSWWDKSDTVGWQAYFHQRNRVVAALLHSPHRHGGALVADLLAHQVKHLAAMQYSVAELRRRAVVDVLAGPERLAAGLATTLPSVRRIQQQFPDARPGPPLAEALPAAPRQAAPSRAGRRPSSAVLAGRAALGLARQLRRERRHSVPQVALRHEEAYWWRLLAHDSALVGTADGTASVHYRRDRRTFLELLRRNVAVHRRLHQEWPELAARYRAAAPHLAAPATWRATFERAGTTR